eukprot:11207492-Lingulodinium_polyedra.AAC.1
MEDSKQANGQLLHHPFGFAGQDLNTDVELALAPHHLHVCQLPGNFMVHTHGHVEVQQVGCL